LAREAEGKEQAEETVESGGEGQGDAVRGRKAIGGDGGTEGAGEKYAEVGEEKKRHPENRGADGEMIVKVAGGGAIVGPGLVIFVEARAAETFVGELVVPGEIEAVLDQWSAGKSVVANAIATHPGIQKW
jgi:hypothetical protein